MLLALLCVFGCTDPQVSGPIIIDDDPIVESPVDSEPEYVDNDGDGFSVEDGDCDDSDASTYPGADESCDDIDHNCDGDPTAGATDVDVYYEDFDGDGYGDPDVPDYACD